MELSQEELAELTTLSDSTRLRTKKLNAEIDLLIMQSQCLRDLSLRMGNYIANNPNLSDAEFTYWSNKADEYFAQAAGLGAIRDIRVQEITILTEDLANEVKKYGIQISDISFTGSISNSEN